MLWRARLPVKDVVFERRQLIVREGKCDKDRAVPLPERCVNGLCTQIARVRQQHESDLERGFGRADLPYALDRKYSNAERELAWQYVFFSPKSSAATRVTRTVPLPLIQHLSYRDKPPPHYRFHALPQETAGEGSTFRDKGVAAKDPFCGHKRFRRSESRSNRVMDKLLYKMRARRAQDTT